MQGNQLTSSCTWKTIVDSSGWWHGLFTRAESHGHFKGFRTVNAHVKIQLISKSYEYTELMRLQLGFD
jgi:hypothetical protein